MVDLNLVQLFVAALGGGFTVKLLDIAYQEWRKGRDKSDTAEQFVDHHLDPLLKSADELVGKLRSLADEDFKSVKNINLDTKSFKNHDFSGLLFLFARFYAQVETVRREGISVAMSKDDRGFKLQKFLDCLEGRRVRILPRVLQRAIGEVTLTDKGPMTYVGFVAAFETEEQVQRWMAPLAGFLSRMEHTTERQQLLLYATVLHAMIDALDPKRAVTRERPSLAHKLTARTWKNLNYRVFGVYLTFINERQKYIGPPRRTARKKGKGGTQRL
ncbi:conserved hypothetical protein (plasmid) [Methylobacterium radiotolerans JCM 2831]|uniref:Uncharacterized protein n=1 Tax=Methylobacterium radiotolerans (strain ATCC 27329 / DSM 1819 / JCM 2831 / NBRC 15690 / NCIMB 10815 / 0-1) TaxID=426355 RepID=B1MAA6_METRJ|nr:conserved hypothetical protein [Methylobacterium radiotolerans JCM 2831]GEN01530.1 hypothetical protein MRA01_60690 [Methylobacterium radiotolerans]